MCFVIFGGWIFVDGRNWRFRVKFLEKEWELIINLICIIFGLGIVY